MWGSCLSSIRISLAVIEYFYSEDLWNMSRGYRTLEEKSRMIDQNLRAELEVTEQDVEIVTRIHHKNNKMKKRCAMAETKSRYKKGIDTVRQNIHPRWLCVRCRIVLFNPNS
jgi:hypothetical protein